MSEKRFIEYACTAHGTQERMLTDEPVDRARRCPRIVDRGEDFVVGRYGPCDLVLEPIETPAGEA